MQILGFRPHLAPSHRKPKGLVAACLLAGTLLSLIGCPPDALAVQVTVNTGSLAGTAGRFEFLLLDGDGVPNNSVVISSLVSNGAFTASECSLGCTGGPPLALADGLGLGLFLYDLKLGTSLSFDLSYSTNFAGVVGVDPYDRFALSLLDPNTNFTLVRTSLLFPDDALLTIDLVGSGVIQTASVTSPNIAVSVSAVPEPAPLALMSVALAALAGRRAVASKRRSVASAN